MTQKQAIQLFEQKKVRTVWDTEKEKWYFSVVDVCGVLTDSKDALTARKYWNKLKQRLKEEGNETVTNCHQLKLRAADGKMRLTDVADTEQLFRLIQSIPSPKAEPFKQWMAQVAAKRIDQMQDPELSFEQAVADYRRLGYSEAWINQRMRSIEVRKHLTDEWKRAGLEEGQQFASIAINMLAEATTTQISKNENPKGMAESAGIARRGGAVANDARKAVEKETGQPVVSTMNAKQIAQGEWELILEDGEE